MTVRQPRRAVCDGWTLRLWKICPLEFGACSLSLSVDGPGALDGVELRRAATKDNGLGELLVRLIEKSREDSQLRTFLYQDFHRPSV